MSPTAASKGIRPVKVAWSMMVGVLRMKSSADSISILPGLSGRDAVAIKPSGLPVVKENAAADGTQRPSSSSTCGRRRKVVGVWRANQLFDFFMGLPRFGDWAEG